MIAQLNGSVSKKLEKAIILNVNNVGYLVQTPKPTLEKLNEQDEIELFIHTKVREDDISLYGFATFAELELFKAVTSISGIGPKIGLEVLSANTEKIKTAIHTKDVAFLSKIPGIGKKTAERMIMELQNKVTPDSLDALSLSNAPLSHEEEHDEVYDAILKLGYQRQEIHRVLKKMPGQIQITEEIITYFLKNV